MCSLEIRKCFGVIGMDSSPTFLLRRGHTVLQVNLPPKIEHVFLVRLSPIQRKIYVEFMNAITESGLCSWANNNPLKAFAVCCKVSWSIGIFSDNGNSCVPLLLRRIWLFLSFSHCVCLFPFPSPPLLH